MDDRLFWMRAGRVSAAVRMRRRDGPQAGLAAVVRRDAWLMLKAYYGGAARTLVGVASSELRVWLNCLVGSARLAWYRHVHGLSEEHALKRAFEDEP